MGSELSCPCGNRPLETEETPYKMDIIEEVMQGKLPPEDIIYTYVYDRTKVCLIRTDDLEKFFNNRNLLRLPDKKEVN